MSDIPFLTGIHVTSFRNEHIHKQNPPPTCTLHAKAGENSRYDRDAGCFGWLGGRKGLKIYTY